jgi:hypothetical protein
MASFAKMAASWERALKRALNSSIPPHETGGGDNASVVVNGARAQAMGPAVPRIEPAGVGAGVAEVVHHVSNASGPLPGGGTLKTDDGSTAVAKDGATANVGAVVGAGLGSGAPARFYLAPFNLWLDHMNSAPWNAEEHLMPTFQNLNFGCNISLLVRQHAATRVPGVVSLESCGPTALGIWDYSAALQNKNLSGLHPQWAGVLDALMGEVVPLMKAGVLAGVFMGDETLCDRVPLSNYTAVGWAVREAIGAGGFIYGNECARPFDDRGEVYSLGPTLPAFLDLISVDYYFRCGLATGSRRAMQMPLSIFHSQFSIQNMLRGV